MSENSKKKIRGRANGQKKRWRKTEKNKKERGKEGGMR